MLLSLAVALTTYWYVYLRQEYFSNLDARYYFQFLSHLKPNVLSICRPEDL